MNLTKLAIFQLVLGQKICFWAHFEWFGKCLSWSSWKYLQIQEWP